MRQRKIQEFVGFAIDGKVSNGKKAITLPNRLSFRNASGNVNPNPTPSMRSPFQTFRWVHFPYDAECLGEFIYRVTPVFMNDADELSYGEAQESAMELRRETYPGPLYVTFTRGCVLYQAFVDRYETAWDISKLLTAKTADGLTFISTHPKADEALEWMDFEARNAILEVLDKAIATRCLELFDVIWSDLANASAVG